MPTMINFIDTKGACKMTYAEECRLRAQMLLDAADGVEFQLKNDSGDWSDVYEPLFTFPVDLYRRKPKKVRHERVLVWVRWPNGDVALHIYHDHDTASRGVRDLEEIKRETVFVKVEE